MEKNELVLVETDNEDFLDRVFFELLLGWIDSGEDREVKVEIESIDDVSTSVDFFRNAQQYALTPGHHVLKVACVLTIEKDGEEESYDTETYYNEDLIKLNFAPGYKYRIEATDEGHTCKFKVKELKLNE